MLQSTYDHIIEHLHILDIDLVRGVVLNRKIRTANKDGYYVLKLKGKPILLHQVIAVIKYGEECVGMTVNHLNEDKLDNRYSNINILSNAENIKYSSYQNGRGKNRKYYVERVG